MRFRIRILLLLKVMKISDHWSTDPPRLNFEPPRLYCERPRPSMTPFEVWTSTGPEFRLGCGYGSGIWLFCMWTRTRIRLFTLMLMGSEYCFPKMVGIHEDLNSKHCWTGYIMANTNRLVPVTYMIRICICEGWIFHETTPTTITNIFFQWKSIPINSSNYHDEYLY